MHPHPFPVLQYMTPGPYSASPKQPLREARDLMEKHGIRHLPVQVDEKLVGILSAHDVDLVWTLAHAPPEALTVEDAMTPNPYSVAPSAPIDEVVRVMADRKIGSAVVVEQEHVVGVFTSTDAMHALADVLGAHAPAAGSTAEERVREEISATARLPDRVTVDEVICVVMDALVRRLTTGEAHSLFDALPDALRPYVHKAVAAHEAAPVLKMDRAELVDRIAERLGVTPAHAELVCGAVFTAVRRELPEKIVRDVAHQLPHGLVELWTDVPRQDTPDVALSALEARRTLEREIEAAGPIPQGLTAEDAFAAVMCSFSERLSRGEAREVLLGLPATLRPLVERCVLHRAEAAEVFGRDELIRRVEGHLDLDRPGAEAVVRAVLGAVKRILPERAVLDVASQLPSDLRALWDAA